jgi:hypothetical protein
MLHLDKKRIVRTESRNQMWTILRYYPSVLLEGLDKEDKVAVRIADIWARNQTWGLQNIKQQW